MVMQFMQLGVGWARMTVANSTPWRDTAEIKAGSKWLIFLIVLIGTTDKNYYCN